MASRSLTYVLVGRDNLSPVVNKAGRNVESESHRITKSFGGVASMAVKAGAAAAVVWGGGNAIMAAVKYNASLEQAKIGFTTMLGSAQKAGSFLKDLQSFAAKTPFEFPELVQASERMVAFGFASKDVIPDLTAIGDAAAGLGVGAEGVDRIVLSIGQMQAKTRVQSDEILQLTESGVPALRILANQYHVTTKKMQEMITKGVVGSSKAIPLLLAGIEKGTKGAAGTTTAFGGMMAAQSKTLTGVWSNFVDITNAKLGQLVTPAMPAIKTALSKLTDLISGKGPAAATMRTAFSELFKGAPIAQPDMRTAGLQRHVADAPPLSGWQKLLIAVHNVAVAIGKAFGPAITGFLRNFVTFAGQAWKAIQNLAVFLAPVVKLMAQAAGAAIIVAFRTLGVLLASVVGPALRGITGYLRDHDTLFKSVALAVLVVVAAMNAWRVAMMINTALVKGIAVVTRAWAIAQGILNVVMTANPIAIVVVAILALAAAFAYAWTHSATFRTIVIGAFDAVKKVVVGVFNWIKQNWPLLLAILTGPFGLVVLIIVKNWDSIRNAGKKALAAIGTAAQFLWTVIATVFGAIIHGAASAFGWVPGLGGKLKDAAKKFDVFRDNVNNAIGGISGKNVNVGVAMTAASNPYPGGISGRKAFGGHVRGPGGPRSDRAGLFALSDGEYVVQSSAVNRYGVGFMDAVNAGRMAAGGGIGVTANTPGPNTIDPFIWNGIVKFVQKNWMASFAGAAMRGFGTGGNGGSGVQKWAGLVLQVLAMLGQSSGWLSTVLRRMNQESGGNQFAVNNWDSNAMAGHPSMGLMQTIPGTFNAYAGPFRGLGIFNALANIYAGCNYAIHAYGSLAGMNRAGGYAIGGPVAFDRGFGTLRPGYSIAYNGTGRDEFLSSRGHGPTIINVNINGHAIASKQELGRIVSDALRAFEGKGGTVSR